jgi:hypothetical protein
MSAAHLAVGDDIDAAILLQRDHFVDGAVFGFLELAGADFLRFPALPRMLQIFRSEQ